MYLLSPSHSFGSSEASPPSTASPVSSSVSEATLQTEPIRSFRFSRSIRRTPWVARINQAHTLGSTAHDAEVGHLHTDRDA